MNSFRPNSWSQASLVVLFLAAACNRPSKPVARVGEQWVGQSQWQAFQSDLPKATAPQLAMDQLVRREVACEQARRTGLLREEAWLAVAPQLRRTILIRSYLDTLPGPPPASEEAIRASYFSGSEERHVVHVLCPTQQAAAAARLRISKGESIEKIADALSKDPSVADNHCDLGWIKQQEMVKEFGQPVFAAKAGDLCGPLQTKFGWHVALVKEVRAPKPADFELIQTLLRDEAHDQANAPKRPQALLSLKAKYPLAADPAVLSLDQTLTLAPGDAKRIAGRIGGVEISLAEVKSFISDAVATGAMQHSLSAAAKTRFLDLLGDDVRLTLAAEQAGLAKRTEILAAIWQAERKAIFNGFSRTFLRKMAFSDQELAKHLGEHSDRFKGVGAVRVNFLVAKDPASAEKAITEGQKGTAWEKLVAGFADKEVTGNWNPGFLDVATLKKVLPPEAAKALVAAPFNAIIGPFNAPDGPMIFKVLERRPGSVMSLDQCREEVREDYVRTHGETLVEKYLDGEGRTGIHIKAFAENASFPTGK